MSKRQRVAEPAAKFGSNNKFKKQRLHPDQQKPSVFQQPNGTKSRQHEPSDAGKTNNTSACPEGLTRSVRKRQRKREKRRLLKAQHRPSLDDHASPKDSRSQYNKHWPQKALGNCKDLPAADPTLLRKVTGTALMSRPVKQWQGLDDANESSCNALKTQRANRSEVVTDAPKNVIDHVARASTQVAREPANIAPAREDSHAAQVEIGSIGQLSPEVPAIVNKRPPPTTSSIATTKHFTATETSLEPAAKATIRPQTTRASDVTMVSGLRGIHMDLNNLGMAIKPLSSAKANAVPSYSGNFDVHSAFKRFDKFANDRNQSDSDDESAETDESDSDSVMSEKIAMPAGQPSLPTHRTEGNDVFLERIGEPAAEITSSTHHPARNVEVPRDIASTDGSARDLDEEDDQDDEDGGVNITANCARNVDIAEAPAQPNDGQDSSELPRHSVQLLEEMTASQTAEPQEIQTMLSSGEETGFVKSLEEEEPGRLENDQPQQRTPDSAHNGMEIDLPLFSALTGATTSGSTEKLSKKSISFLGLHHGGQTCSPGPSRDFTEVASRSEQTHRTGSVVSVPDDAGSDAEDVLFRSINAISTEVFGSTRSLPFSKPSPDMPIQEKLALTESFSAARVDSASPSGGRAVRRSSPIVYICDVPHVDCSELITHDEPAGDPNGEYEVYNNSTAEQELKPSSSPLSQLNRSPTPPSELQDALNEAAAFHCENRHETQGKRKRKMTGITSKHWSPTKRTALDRPSNSLNDAEQLTSEDVRTSPTIYATPATHATKSTKRTRTPRKSTTRESHFFTPAESPTKPSDTEATTPVPRKRRVPAGTSTSPVPSTTQAHFGLIQEKLHSEPFWLLIAVTFLNKTAGKAAAPIFWSLKEKYSTPEALAEADVDELIDMIYHLGLQTQRAKRLVSIAKAWTESPPEKGVRYRTLHYPVKGAGKELKPQEVVEEDAVGCEGALEIGQIPGCGPYAWDSWRIFARDVLRGVAEGYNGEGARQGFEPEWQRVLPLDKELRACLRWMWLREGWVWNCETGEKRIATEEEVEKGKIGEMNIEDEGERRFAEQAAGAGGGEEADPMIEATAVDKEDGADESAREVAAKRRKTSKAAERKRRTSLRKSVTDDS